MIVNDKDAATRLASPLNLINKLKDASSRSASRNNAMSLFIKPNIETKAVEPQSPTPAQLIPAVVFNPFQPKTEPKVVESPVTIEDISNDHDSKIKLGLAHDKALQLLTDSVSALALKLDDVKADKLPSVIAAASKTVESIRRERNEASKNNKDREVHYHFYTPTQKTLDQYEVIEVSQ